MGEEKSPPVDELIESIEDMLEERKQKNDRRKAVDPNSPYIHPDKDRRSGKDRRDPD